MAKRLTAEQKDALKAYSRAEFGYDLYTGSVFVNEANTAFNQRWVEQAHAKCVGLGLDVAAPSFQRLSNAGV